MRFAVLCCLIGSATPLVAEPPSADKSLPVPADTASLPVLEAPSERWTLQGDFLVWWLRRDRVPPLLTTSPAASQGIIGQPGTEVVYPGSDGKLASRHDRFVGAAFTVGYWLDGQQDTEIEIRGFFLERDSSNFTIKQAPAGMLLARPYTNALTVGQGSEILAGPSPGIGDLTGGVNVYSRVEVFGEEANLLAALWRGDDWRLDLIGGARFLQMRDRVDITSASYLLPAQTTMLADSDHFWTFDSFYGGQVGLSGSYSFGRWFAHLRGTIGLGATEQQVKAKGDRTFQTPAARIEQPFGLYVLPTNSGNFDRWAFDAVSEVELTLGYQITTWLNASVGYSYLYWNNPVRAGDQIDVINPTQMTRPLAGPVRPMIPFKEDFFWAQGVRLGLEIRW